MSTPKARGPAFLSEADIAFRERAHASFEISLRWAAASDEGTADGLAYVRDLLEIARQAAQMVFGTRWEAHVMETYDRIVAEQRYRQALQRHAEDTEA